MIYAFIDSSLAPYIIWRKRMSKYISVITLSIFFIIATFATISYADDISATTEDGRSVILHDDGTWESVELSEEERAVEIVKRLQCSRGGTVEQYLIRKIETSSVEDLGWKVYPKKDGFEVERSLLRKQKILSRYKWYVNEFGNVKPLNGKAIGITKE
jgi:hypothetical protein